MKDELIIEYREVGRKRWRVRESRDYDHAPVRFKTEAEAVKYHAEETERRRKAKWRTREAGPCLTGCILTEPHNDCLTVTTAPARTRAPHEHGPRVNPPWGQG